MKISLPLYSIDGKATGNSNIDSSIFNEVCNTHILALTVDAYLAKGRSGTACAQTRAEVSYANTKPWKQKGTGRARAGSKRSPVWVGGGVHFPPKPRSYAKHQSKAEKKAALRIAIDVKKNDIILFNELPSKTISTKVVSNVMKELNFNSILWVTGDRNEAMEKSVSNLPNSKVVCVNQLNVFDIMKYEKVAILKSAWPQIESYCLVKNEGIDKK